MFTTESILSAFKSMEVADVPQNLTHAQTLDFKAKLFGFAHYYHLKTDLEKAPADRAAHIHDALMRKICAARLPNPQASHVRMVAHDDEDVGFDSYWIGWDKRGDEVREARAGFGRSRIEAFRARNPEPLYLLGDAQELIAWLKGWHSNAAVPVELAKEFFPDIFDQKHLVAENPPYELIDEKVKADMLRRGLKR
ncbi:hypothetical protein [Pseudomonas sp. BP8]|uniref:hypothetical protein n=1 Tax=Pseudomonas sp. BP8 TaxID=2817864 RepID=UPI001AE79D15|nr:hypothetical protein [Pseudomonas sp. BP8]MBP2262397.1 hypothetical protein [Pseudomonas sp. BP8]HDS1733310.1 hypothetical protein [Pseudomonas putida]